MLDPSHESARRRCPFLRGLAFVALAAMTLPASALADATLVAARLVQSSNVALQFDLDRSAGDAELFTLADPHRLVIDLPSTTLADDVQAELNAVGDDTGPVASIRYGLREGGTLRLVVDLRRAVNPAYGFVERDGGRSLRIDLGANDAPAVATTSRRAREPASLRDVVVAIDAGHGGKDPGAIGGNDTREKDVTLQIARRLYSRLSAVHGITPVMVREEDVYMGLRERMARARAKHADLFVSIHADAFKRREARGSSVYILSTDGASSEAAAWLAKSENESDALFGNVALDGLEASLRETLLNLTQSSTLEASMGVGAEVLDQLETIGSVHKPRVEQANFMVLKSPDIPSVLIETAFISNREEEEKLNDPEFQERLAVAIADGLSAWLARRAPQGTLLAAERRARG